MRTAGHFLLASAALHVIGAVLTGFAPTGLFLLLRAAIYAALFAGLRRGWMWVGWLAFLCMLGGMAGTVAELVTASPVPGPVLWSILGADAVVAGLLFAALWRGPRRKADAA